MKGVYLNESEASYPKEPTKFNDFTYDNTNNRLFNLLDDMRVTSNRICDDIDDVNDALDELEDKYEQEGSYDDYINDAIAVLSSNLNNFQDLVREILTSMKDNISEIENRDENLMNEIRSLQEKLKEGV